MRPPQHRTQAPAPPRLGLSRAAGAIALAVSLVMWIPSCADVLGLGAERNVADELCDLLHRCYGERVPADCQQQVGTSLARADDGVAAAWLTRFADADCLADCTTARRCLDAEPVCGPVGESCTVLEECCGFTAGKGSCDIDAERCCRPRGTSCSSDADCCPDAGRCAEETGTCGGVVCKDAGAACAIGAECCTKLCDESGHCSDLTCQPDGAKCQQDQECCTGVCSDGACGIPGCSGEGAPCADSIECCPEYTCFMTAEGAGGVCSINACLPDGLPCQDPAECCSLYCDPSFAQCGTLKECVPFAETCVPGDICCEGVCNEMFTCGCAAEGVPCTFASDCCSGICDGITCGTPGCSDWGESCGSDGDCCSGVCGNEGICVWGSCATPATPFVCQNDLCTASDHPLDPSCAGVNGECVAAVCTADYWCCCVAWDYQCTTEVLQYCNEGC